MSELPEAQNYFRLQVENWCESKGILFQSRNRKLEVPVGKDWARLSILSVDSKSACLGNKWFRDQGIFVVSLFFQLGSGSATPDKLAYELRDAFSEWQYKYLETHVGQVVEVPSTLDFYHINVNLPFRHK